jgi:hypothetical protein
LVRAPADYDGDRRADIAVFRPSDGVWYLNQSTAGLAGARSGVATDVAVPNAFVPSHIYDGDGKSDIAIYRPSLGRWWVTRSTAGIIVLTFGIASDKPVQRDFSGDGKT